MSRELLLKYFDRISDVPDAIPRLRQFILDLAVRGKLVEQDPADERASVLIRRFEIQKLRLLNAGEIRKQRLFDRNNEEEIPIATPAGWEWMYLGSASTMITKGSTPTSYGHPYTPEGINFIKVESITDNRLLPENVTSFISEDTHRPGQIKQIRQAILSLAIRGKLVKQDSRDRQAASVLGDRQLELTPDQTPWTLPSGWAWTSLRLAGRVLGGGTPSKGNPEFWSGPIPWVSPKDMKVDLICDAEDHISELAVTGSAVKIIPAGALLMVVRGMILAHSFPTAISKVPVTINQDMKAIVPFRPDAARMLMLALKGLKPEILGLVLRSTHGTCRLETDALLSLPIPFPPIEEQKRILARVDELMTLCDQLEAQLTATQTEGRHLLEAVMYEALNPAVVREAA